MFLQGSGVGFIWTSNTLKSKALSQGDAEFYADENEAVRDRLQSLQLYLLYKGTRSCLVAEQLTC